MIRKIRQWSVGKQENSGESAGGSGRPSVNRRSFLRKSTGTTFGVGSIAAMSGTAMAYPDVDESALQEAMEAYDTPSDVKRALRVHSDELLQTLADENILTSPSIRNLPVGEVKDTKEYVKASNGTLVSVAAQDGTATAHIVISTTTEDHSVLIVVQPQVARSYAIVKPAGGRTTTTSEMDNSPTIYDPDQEEVTIDACVVGQVCKPCGCEINFCKTCVFEVHCCDTYCYWGDKLKDYCPYEDFSIYCCGACGQC